MPSRDGTPPAEPAGSPRDHADDIIESCGKIRRFIAGMTFEAFVADERTRDAVIRNLEVIGEAAKNLPDDVIAKAPEVEWRKVRGMRDVLAHGYFGLNTKVVWSTATTKLDALETAVRGLLA
jgi:uncharacterized protein with HEPN domain